MSQNSKTQTIKVLQRWPGVMSVAGRGPEVDSQNPHQVTHSCLELQLQRIRCPIRILRTPLLRCIHAPPRHTHVIKKKSKNKKFYKGQKGIDSSETESCISKAPLALPAVPHFRVGAGHTSHKRDSGSSRQSSAQETNDQERSKDD